MCRGRWFQIDGVDTDNLPVKCDTTWIQGEKGNGKKATEIWATEKWATVKRETEIWAT